MDSVRSEGQECQGASGPMLVLVTTEKTKFSVRRTHSWSLYGVWPKAGVNIASVYLEGWTDGYMGQNQNPLVVVKTTPRKLTSCTLVSGNLPARIMLS